MEKKLKLNVKNTILVGLAFSSIGIFWTSYDFIMPLMLNRTFGLPDSIRGLIMGLDNILALILLPIFGAISDRVNTKWGKRTPFIVIGTLVAIILMLALPLTEGIQLKKAEQTAATITNQQLWEYAPRATHAHLVEIGGYDIDVDTLSEADKEVLEADFLAISKTVVGEDGKEIENEDYVAAVQPALRNYIYQEITVKHPTVLIVFVLVLFLLLVTFATYRSPAVALMPDVTPEPLRSPANSIINLMGGIGGGLAMIGYTVLLSTLLKGYYKSYTLIFLYIVVLMALLVSIFLATVREKKLVKECHEICLQYGIDTESIKAEKVKVGFRDMPKNKLRNFLLILVGIFMCTMSTNAIVSSLSVYAVDELRFDPGTASIITMVGYVLSALAFIPVGFLSTKLGRKKTVLLGFAVTIASLLLGYVLTVKTRMLFILMYVVQNFGGVFIGVNTLPMVLESGDTRTIGKFTGLYYTATMSASSITPFISGLFMEQHGRRIMFIYSIVCMLVAIVLFAFVKSKDQTYIANVPAD